MTILVQYFYLNNILFILQTDHSSLLPFLPDPPPNCSPFNTKWSILIDVQTIQSTEMEGFSIWEKLEYEHFNGAITPTPLKDFIQHHQEEIVSSGLSTSWNTSGLLSKQKIPAVKAIIESVITTGVHCLQEAVEQ